MARIIGGIGTAHVPAIGAAVDHGKQEQDYWRDFFAGIEPCKEWMQENQPDVCFIVYNDHASAFSLENISTFTIGVAEEFEPADEGYGPRQVPIVKGHPEFAWHLAESLILSEFDLTISNNMPVDHGLTVPLSIAYDQPEAWPCRVIPFAVNVIQYPPPTANRCYQLGKTLRKAIDAFGEDITVAVFGTGGMSHQLQGERAGLINKEFDFEFLDLLVSDPAELANWPHTDFIREAGSEGIELIMWLIMRGAMDAQVEEKYRFYHVPVSNTGYGLTILENK